MKTKLLFLFLAISLLGFSQTGQKTISQTFQLMEEQNVSYFEVTKDMFKMLSESRGASPEYKEYISKLSSLKMVQATGENKREAGQQLYKLFNSNANLKDYSRLMTKSEPNGKLSFYKKDGKSENEFLLVSTEMIIYITGTINLKSIGEFEQVMEVAGSAFDM